MATITLYHGSPNEMVNPTFGLGQDKHDYGRGFYLTRDLQLAKEWAVSRPDGVSGFVHTFLLETDGLSIIDFERLGSLCWLAELMKHRDAVDSKRYRMLAAKFVKKYGVDTRDADVITGRRADASYFYIAKAFVRDEVDVDILPELLSLGGLGIQWCIKSQKAYSQLKKTDAVMPVDFNEYNAMYNDRDNAARFKMMELINSDKNKVEKVFSTLI